MKILPTFPVYASTAGDFTTRSTHLEPEDRVVLLDVEVDNLPSGMLCLSSATVRSIVLALGWKIQTPEDETALKDARRHLAQALEQLEAYDDLLKALERAFTMMPVTSESPIADDHPSVTVTANADFTVGERITKLEVAK